MDFQEDAHRNQRNYRVLLEAMANPGRRFAFAPADTAYPDLPAMAVAQCLLDHEVGFCVVGEGREPNLSEVIFSATGARVLPVNKADFLFISGPQSGGALRLAKKGRPEAPEEGATVVYLLDQTVAEDSERLRIGLSGPGIPSPRGIVPDIRGLLPGELFELAAVNAEFPLGVDAIFLGDQGEVLCIPRSTRIHWR